MRKRERTPFGERLYQARKEAKLTQARLAELAGMAQGTLAEAEYTGSGSTYTPQLAAACQVRAEWLATGIGPMQPAGPMKGAVFHMPTEDERRILDDLRVLLDDDRDQFARDIAAKAAQMRAYTAKIMQRITPAPSPHRTDSPPID